MTGQELLQWVQTQLSHVPHNKRLAGLVTSEVLQVSALQVPLVPNVTKPQQHHAKKLCKKLKYGMPFVYATGQTTFLGTTILVTKHTLIPRQETELLAEMVASDMKLANQTSAKLLDLCCGTGAIGVSVGRCVGCEVTLSDISKKALKVAKQNAKNNQVFAHIIKSNMFANICEQYDIIVSNPPYIPTSDLVDLEPSVKNFEPMLALDGKQDGLYFYKQIAQDAPQFLKNGGKLFLEIGQGQAHDVVNLLQENFKDILVLKDYAQNERMICATKKEKEAKKL